MIFTGLTAFYLPFGAWPPRRINRLSIERMCIRTVATMACGGAGSAVGCGFSVGTAVGLVIGSGVAVDGSGVDVGNGVSVGDTLVGFVVADAIGGACST